MCESDQLFEDRCLASRVTLVLSIWTARIRGMVAVRFVIKTFSLITVRPAEQANQLFRTGHCYEGADNGQIIIGGFSGYNVNH